MSSKYALGYSEREIKRLHFQSSIIEPITIRMLRSCGISRGQNVLDIGSGTGCVSRLASIMVGSTGSVTGIEQSCSAINIANRDKKDNISYICGKFEEVAFNKKFDVVVGRAVLLFQDKIHLFLEKAANLVKPGGYLAFHEIDDSRQFHSYPPVGLWDRTMAELLIRLKKVCPQYDISRRFVKVFDEVGISIPNITYEIPVAGGRAEKLCFWAVETLCSLSENPESIFFSDGFKTNSKSLLYSLQNEIYKNKSQVEFLGQSCAWVKIK